MFTENVSAVVSDHEGNVGVALGKDARVASLQIAESDNRNRSEMEDGSGKPRSSTIAVPPRFRLGLVGET